MPLPTRNSAPLERRLLRDIVYERIYAGIIDGTLEPGETLLDETLTTWLGVSRTPVREALMRLADIGLVEMAPNRYTRVAPLDLRAIDEGVAAAGILLEQAVRRAVPHLGSPEIAELARQASEAKTNAKAGDGAALARAVDGFFFEFERASGDAVLLAAAEGLRPQVLRYVTVWTRPFDVDNLPAELDRIVAAAKEGDAEAAARLVGELFGASRRQFLDEYRRTDVDIDANPLN
ncbi:GntR family transcriptional regulator [Leifsonia poae]|uniref:Transcriptional regulator, GntR family protein n=1 Tax=Leifsonia poae TaxID=110933 RepID=A0A9W6HAG0_9MICO|nr:GntR family transcriptional regulator [Leifsonia poae]GLJ76317.1 putative transcriptional regulator, GntR family protein [Leifsonia poae]